MNTNISNKNEGSAPWGKDNISANFWSILCITYGAWQTRSSQPPTQDS